MTIDENAMRFLEEQIPELANLAVKQAYWQALGAGCSVLERENNHIVEVQPDGTRKVIKNIPPSIPVTKGQRLEI